MDSCFYYGGAGEMPELSKHIDEFIVAFMREVRIKHPNYDSYLQRDHADIFAAVREGRGIISAYESDNFYSDLDGTPIDDPDWVINCEATIKRLEEILARI